MVGYWDDLFFWLSIMASDNPFKIIIHVPIHPIVFFG